MEKEKAYMRKKLESSAAKLLTAKGDHDVMKKRILELQDKNSSLDGEFCAAKTHVAKLEKLVAEKTKDLEAQGRRMNEKEGDLKTETERALLSCERKLREEQDKELKEVEKRNRLRNEELEDNLRRVTREGEEKMSKIKIEWIDEVKQVKEEGDIRLKKKEERIKEAEWDVGVLREESRKTQEKMTEEITRLKGEHLLELDSMKASHEEVKLALKTVREEMAIEMNERDKKAIGNLRKSVGEERARACRAMQRAREEFAEVSSLFLLEGGDGVSNYL